jgi:hypothetical protein
VYCVAENGDILRLNKKGEIEVVFTILGQPSCLAFKEGEGVFLISDFAHQTIFSREESTNFQIHNMITEFNGRAYLGPNSIKVGQFTSNNSHIQKISFSLIPDRFNRLQYKTELEVFLSFVHKTKR